MIEKSLVKKLNMIITTAFLFFSAVGLFAHGVRVTVEKKSPVIVVHAGYHGGKALAHAGVIIAFGKEKTIFQEGSTDKNGNFYFSPDKSGNWNVTVDDQMGHRGKKTITVGEDFFTVPVKKSEPKAAEEETIPGQEKKQQEKPKPETSPFPTGVWCCYLLKIVLAIALILVITFILHRWVKRQETSKKGK